MTKPILFVAAGDTHAGSRLGLCPPQGVEDAEGGRWLPGEAGQWLWNCWLFAWNEVSQLRKQHKARLWVGLTGDTVDGFHHVSGAHELISTNPEEHSYIAHEVFAVVKKLRPEHVWAVRGTQVHVGPDGASEESIAKDLHAERWAHKHTAQVWRIQAHDTLIDLRHHPGTRGTRPHTRQAGIDRLARLIWDEHKQAAMRAEKLGREVTLQCPDLAVRGHFHAFDASSEWGCPVRAVICPSMQLASSYVRQRAAPESVSEVGIVAFLIEPGNRITMFPILFYVEPPPPWTP